MAKSTANRTLSKKMIKCPYCMNPEPKELVETETKKSFSLKEFINNPIYMAKCILMPWTVFGRKEGYAAYCTSCNKTFPADGWM